MHEIYALVIAVPELPRLLNNEVQFLLLGRIATGRRTIYNFTSKSNDITVGMPLPYFSFFYF